MNPITAHNYIFDFDGTLSECQFPWNDIKKQLGSLTGDSSRRNDERSLNEILYRLEEKGNKDKALSLLERFEQQYLSNITVDTVFIDRIRKSKKPHETYSIFSNNISSTIKNALRRENQLDVFDLIVGREQVKKYKPHPEGIQLIMKKLSITIHDTVYIGDSAYDKEVADKSEITYYHVREYKEIIVCN